MKKTTILFLIFVIAAVMITGCTSTPPTVAQQPTTVATMPPTVVVTTPATPAVPVQLAGNWVVTRLGIQDGTAVINPTTQITLTFSPDGTLYGNGGCNNYNGPFTLTGATTPKGMGISIGPLVSTKKVCEYYSQQETMYLNILGKAMAYNVDGNQLSITATTGDVLIYQTPASLVTPVQYPHPA